MRKEARMMDQPALDPLHFNGAALFQVRKGWQKSGAKVGKTKTSMGPHFFKCGKLDEGDEEDCQRDGTSMGPHFFKCGKLKAQIKLLS